MTPPETSPVHGRPGTPDDIAKLIEDVRSALENVVDPCSIAAGAPINVLDMGIIRDIVPEGENVVVGLRPTSPFCFQLELISQKIREMVDPVVRGQCRVDTITADDWVPEMMSEGARARLRAVRNTAR